MPVERMMLQMMKANSPIYLDNAATTKIRPEVRDIIDTALELYGNPSSLYTIGQTSKRVIDESRNIIAKHINCADNEIIFTSSGSEADNLALKSFYFAHINDCTIITTTIEHKAIINSCGFLERLGATIQYVNVDSFGQVDLTELDRLCRNAKGKLLVSIQYANNEIGTIQDIKAISEIVHKYNGILHTDAVQAFPEIQIDVRKLGTDMMSVSGHKFGIPKGIGFLYKNRDVEIEPLIHGGQQEYELRAGTENIAYIVGILRPL